MTLQLSSLRSRVAWRVFVLFLFAAALPMLAAGFLAYHQVNKVLAAQAQDQLYRTAKTYGLSVLARLQDSDAMLRKLPADFIHRTDVNAHHGDELLEEIEALAGVTANGELRVVIGAVPALDARWLSDASQEQSTLFSHTGADRSTAVYLAVPVPSGTAGYRLLIARLNPAYLWGDRDLFPYLVGIRVTDDHNTVLYDSPVVGEIAPRLELRPPEAVRGVSQRIIDDEGILATVWEVFLSSHFDTRSWRIVALQPKALALAPLTSFKAMFPAVALMLLLVVALLSARQIRRQMVPLEKLIAATRNIAANRFDQHVEVRSSDEFQDLAQAFNRMSSHLQRQFRFLTVLSEIDHKILSLSDIDEVLETAINHINEIIRCDGACIILFDDSIDSSAGSHAGRRYCSLSRSLERVVMVPTDLPPIPAGSDVLEVDVATSDLSIVSRFKSNGVSTACIFPIHLDQQMHGYIILAFNDAKCDSLDMQHAIDLAGRFAVALAAVSREERLYLQAHFDVLTGLPNRHLLMDRIGQEISHARRGGYKVAVLFLDLDRFKSVNDSAGHAAGDELLKQAAERLRNILDPATTIARLGGDEFTVVLSGLGDAADVQPVADDIIYALSRPYTIDGNEHFISVSIGITLFPGGGETVTELLKNADMAMYRSKEKGRGKYTFYEEQMNQDVVERSLLERDLRYAVDRDEFRLFYQPQIDVRSGRTRSAEALIRWQHPTRGFISPVQFISLAEESGYVDILGEWVLRAACRQMAEWRSEALGIDHVSVNVSSRQFMQDNFVLIVRSALDNAGLPAACLELEITESTLMDYQARTAAKLEELRGLGIRLSIDDFGTGYSSLAYLKRLPIDSLKIDRTFIRDLPLDADATAITTTIIAMANALKLSVIAEGVETQQQLEFLSKQRCDLVQGYLYSPPVTAAAFAEFVRQGVRTNARLGVVG